MLDVEWHDLSELGEAAADDLVEGFFELGEDGGLEVDVVEFTFGKRDELAPLVAPGEHVGDEGLAVLEVAVAVQEQDLEGEGEVGVVAAEQHEGAAGGLGEEG